MLQVILGSFGVFPIFNNLVFRKRQVLERNIHNYVIQFYVVIVCHLVKQSKKAPGLDFLSILNFKLTKSSFCVDCHMEQTESVWLKKNYKFRRSSDEKIVFQEKSQCTKWPQNDLEHYKVNVILYTYMFR